MTEHTELKSWRAWYRDLPAGTLVMWSVQGLCLVLASMFFVRAVLVTLRPEIDFLGWVFNAAGCVGAVWGARMFGFRVRRDF
jgi:hypothetical protein